MHTHDLKSSKWKKKVLYKLIDPLQKAPDLDFLW